MENAGVAEVRKRLSRYKREKTPPPLVLQARDRRIIGAVAQHRFLSREQIERLFFGTTTRTNFRLQKLYHHRFLNRLHLPTVRGSSQAIYCLDKEGVPVAAEILGSVPASIPWKFKNRDIAPLFLNHLLAVNDIRVAFELAARSNPEHELLLWMSETEAKDEYVWGYERKVLTPDAYGRYKFGERVLSFFVEVDQATMSAKRWREKLERYVEYGNSQTYEKRFGMKFFRVLVVTTSQKRLSNLLSITSSRTERGYWFATLDEIHRQGILGQIWRIIGGRSEVGLLT